MKNKKKGLILILAIVVIAVAAFFIISNQNKQQGAVSSNSEQTQEQKDIPVVEEEPNAKAEIIEKKDASYEEWLAAAMMVAVSLKGEEFEVEHIYYKTETDLADKQDSEGVYLIYKTGGKSVCVKSTPLKKERNKKGKTDLSTQDLGFATFDTVDKDSKDFDGWKEIKEDSLSDLVSQSMLVSLYEN